MDLRKDISENMNVSSSSFNSATTEKFPVFLLVAIVLVVFFLIACGVYCFLCRDRSSENNTIRKERSKKRSFQRKTGNNPSKVKHLRLSHRRGRDSSHHNRNSQSRNKPPRISSKVARMTSSEVIKLPPNVKLI